MKNQCLYSFSLILLFFLLIACSKEEPVIQYELKTIVSPSDGGSVSPSNGNFTKGEIVILTPEPSANYIFKNWSGNVSGIKNPVTITLDSNKTVTANFEIKDTDGDGVTDDMDTCPDTPDSETVNAYGCSINCTETISDIDGNLYTCVTIGSQVWLAENLKTTKYRNGDNIPNITDNAEWSNLNSGAYSNYMNDPINAIDYGRLYNWYAIDDDRKLCPLNWHVPSDEEWKTLEKHLGMSETEANNIEWRGTTEGGKLKETGLTHWESINEGATNSSGFTAIPSGYRYGPDGNFLYIGKIPVWWTSTQDGNGNVWTRSLSRYLTTINRNVSDGGKESGFCVRCIKD